MTDEFFVCRFCGAEFPDGHKLVDHLTDAHDAFSKLVDLEVRAR